MKLYSKKDWKAKGLDVINSHFGKKRVYEMYLRIDPNVAEKYLRFVASHTNAIYITWDGNQQCFKG